MVINRYLPFALLYFFINAVGLPFGLTYTALLAPLFLWWMWSSRKWDILSPFAVVLFPFVLIHVVLAGVDNRSYALSVLNLAAVYIFCQAFYTFLKKSSDPEAVFKKVTIINFVLCLVAIPFYFSSYAEFFWIRQFLTEGVDDFPRLRLFTYEASHYATLMVPLFFLYFLKVVMKQNRINAWIVLFMIVLPLILSFSVGVISCILISILGVFVLYLNRLIVNRRVISILILSTAVVIPVIVLGVLYYPENTLSVRLQNIVSGEDSSGRGRTGEAFTLAQQILYLKTGWWGIGPGQIKIIGAEIIRDFYLYPLDYRVAIPNAVAETLALFGWIGLGIRIGIELVLFFYTQVWKSYFRLLLFLFVFVYQFTGSFITNIAEYVIWILAFTEVFPGFRVASEHHKHQPLL